MVAAISSHQQNEQTRPPLLSSTPKPKPKAREVSSRYMSPTPRRFPSPLLSRSTNSTVPARSVSADRRRRPPETSSSSSSSAAAKLLATSTRSLSVSFQGEAFSLPVAKPTPDHHRLRRRPTPTLTPSTDRHSENSRPWPARSRHHLSDSLTRSVDFGSGFGSARRLSVDSRSSSAAELPLQLSIPRHAPSPPVSSDLAASDSESVSSGGSPAGSIGGFGASSRSRSAAVPRGLIVSPKFWQETNSRLRRLQDPGSPISPISRMGTSPGARFPQPVTSSPRMASSPIRGASRPASPSRMSTTPSRGSASPSRARNGSNGGCLGSSTALPSILSFSMDVRRGKMGEDRILDAHMLRLLYNRYLQWRFVNARADSTCMVHKLNAEKNLWNAWLMISELRHSVKLKRIKLLLLRQKLKLTSIIKGQIATLEDWSLLERDHSNSLVGATEALKASTLRLPVVGKTVADIQKVKDAVGSAVDVMQAMGTSICSLTVKVENMNSLVAELVKVTGKEQILLKQCQEFLSTLAAMQVESPRRGNKHIVSSRNQDIVSWFWLIIWAIFSFITCCGGLFCFV